jgi:hypothetical protein
MVFFRAGLPVNSASRPKKGIVPRRFLAPGKKDASRLRMNPEIAALGVWSARPLRRRIAAAAVAL